MKILVADDESMIRMGLRSMLRELGHVAILAKNGQDALRKSLAENPDLAILDIQMPKTNGLQLAKALNKHQPMPIIFLTAYSQDELVDQATSLNVQGYLLKPTTSAELKVAISVAVKRFRDLDRAEKQLSARKEIDRAKALLIARGLSEQAAFSQIQQEARSSNRSMDAVAREILGE
ncbi:MAG: ANTAR domain-containing response regulator [Candidatus Promineifilaceae bacterium]